MASARRVGHGFTIYGIPGSVRLRQHNGQGSRRQGLVHQRNRRRNRQTREVGAELATVEIQRNNCWASSSNSRICFWNSSPVPGPLKPLWILRTLWFLSMKKAVGYAKKLSTWDFSCLSTFASSRLPQNSNV